VTALDVGGPVDGIRTLRVTARVDHALQALVQLAGSGSDPLTGHELSRRGAVSSRFLATILTDLRAHGLVRATRGPHGGFRLARPPAEITVAQVVDAADTRTPTPLDGTGATTRLWAELEQGLQDRLAATTVADVAAGRGCGPHVEIQDGAEQSDGRCRPEPPAPRRPSD